MAGMYIKKHGSTDLTTVTTQNHTPPAVLRWRSESYQVSGPRINPQSNNNRPAELKVVELRKLSFALDEQFPTNFQRLNSVKNETRKSVVFQNKDELILSNKTNLFRSSDKETKIKTKAKVVLVLVSFFIDTILVLALVKNVSLGLSLAGRLLLYFTNSWWYVFCLKCRKKEVGPGWEPKHWSRTFPHPYWPSFRHVARILALLVTVLSLWGVVFAIMGPDAKPGGQLFNIAVLVVSAYLGGWVFRMLTLPALVGMLLVGMFYQNIGFIHIEGKYKEFSSVLRKIALMVIFTRAGLDLDPVALKKLYCRVMFLAIVPWCAELTVISVSVYYLLGLPWPFAMLCGSIIAAVSPAVVVPCLFRLKSKGYGVAKGIPTLIIAVAGIDDALSVIAFGVGTSMLFGKNSVTYNLLISPLSILAGITYGLVLGCVVKYIPERTDPYVAPLRILIITGGGFLAVFGFEKLNLEGAGPLAVIITAFTSICFWTKQGWAIEDNPVATAFEIFWMVCEPILFGLTGTQIVFNELDLKYVTITVACIAIAFVTRICVTIIAASGSTLNFKEKLFIALSWMAKAAVQAVLGPAVLEIASHDGNQEIIKFAQTIVTACIISIMLTAPVGAIIVSLSGSKLLTKAKPDNDQWRRGPRRSIRDITLSDEDEDDGTYVTNDDRLQNECDRTTDLVEIQNERI